MQTSCKIPISKSISYQSASKCIYMSLAQKQFYFSALEPCMWKNCQRSDWGCIWWPRVHKGSFALLLSSFPLHPRKDQSWGPSDPNVLFWGILFDGKHSLFVQEKASSLHCGLNVNITQGRLSNLALQCKCHLVYLILYYSTLHRNVNTSFFLKQDFILLPQLFQLAAL